MALLDKLDELRISIDSLIQKAVAVKSSAETTLAWRSLQMGKAWLGKFKAELGATNPYSVASEAKDIPPTAETYNGDIVITGDKLKDVNAIRASIQLHVDEVSAIGSDSNCVLFAVQHLSEAKMWYGFELQNMRESVAKA
jgi:hypothetical protein